MMALLYTGTLSAFSTSLSGKHPNGALPYLTVSTHSP